MKRIFIIIVLVIAVSASCIVCIKLAQEYERICEGKREWYEKTLNVFGQESILKTVDAVVVKAEYRVVHNVSFEGDYYYSLKVFTDGTGEFTFMVNKSDDFRTWEIVLDVSKAISAEETNTLLKAIGDNRFFLIPTVQPSEWLTFWVGLDGETVFVEGYDGSRTHFITMWEPDEKYGISKILKAFAGFADTIAERPDLSSDYDIESVFEIVKDTRAIKTDLTGRYVWEENENFYIEIYDDHVVSSHLLLILINDRFANERTIKTVELLGYKDALSNDDVTEIVFISTTDDWMPKTQTFRLEDPDAFVGSSSIFDPELIIILRRQ